MPRSHASSTQLGSTGTGRTPSLRGTSSIPGEAVPKSKTSERNAAVSAASLGSTSGILWIIAPSVSCRPAASSRANAQIV